MGEERKAVVIVCTAGGEVTHQRSKTLTAVLEMWNCENVVMDCPEGAKCR